MSSSSQASAVGTPPLQHGFSEAAMLRIPSQLTAHAAESKYQLSTVLRVSSRNNIGNILRRDWLFGVVVRRKGFGGVEVAIDRPLRKILEDELDPSGFLLACDFGNQFKRQIDAAGDPAACPNIAALYDSFFLEHRYPSMILVLRERANKL